MSSQEKLESFQLYELACRYLSLDEWYAIFITHDYTTRPYAMVQAAQLKAKGEA